jgi:hypothetical protein
VTARKTVTNKETWSNKLKEETKKEEEVEIARKQAAEEKKRSKRRNRNKVAEPKILRDDLTKLSAAELKIELQKHHLPNNP